MRVSLPFISRRDQAHQLGGPPVMPKWPWPTARNRPAGLSPRPASAGCRRRRTEAHPEAVAVGIHLEEHRADIGKQGLGAALIGRRLEACDLDPARYPESMLHRCDAEGTAPFAMVVVSETLGVGSMTWNRARPRAARGCRAAEAGEPSARRLRRRSAGRMESDIGHDIIGAVVVRQDLHHVLGQQSPACLEEQPMKRLHDALRAHGVAIAGHQHATTHGRRYGEKSPQVVEAQRLAGECLGGRATCAPRRHSPIRRQPPRHGPGRPGAPDRRNSQARATPSSMRTCPCAAHAWRRRSPGRAACGWPRSISAATAAPWENRRGAQRAVPADRSATTAPCAAYRAARWAPRCSALIMPALPKDAPPGGGSGSITTTSRPERRR